MSTAASVRRLKDRGGAGAKITVPPSSSVTRTTKSLTPLSKKSAAVNSSGGESLRRSAGKENPRPTSRVRAATASTNQKPALRAMPRIDKAASATGNAVDGGEPRAEPRARWSTSSVPRVNESLNADEKISGIKSRKCNIVDGDKEIGLLSSSSNEGMNIDEKKEAKPDDDGKSLWKVKRRAIRSEELESAESTSEVKPEKKSTSPIDENPIALEFLASLNKEQPKVTTKYEDAGLQIFNVQDVDDAVSSENQNSSSKLFKGKESVDHLLASDENLKVLMLKRIGRNVHGGGGRKIVTYASSMRLAVRPLLEELESKYVILMMFWALSKPPVGVSSNMWRDCWIIRAPGVDGSSGRYVVAASANSMDSGPEMGFTKTNVVYGLASPLQWRSRGKVVIAETEGLSLWDVNSISPQALLSVSSSPIRQISALHMQITQTLSWVEEFGRGLVPLKWKEMMVCFAPLIPSMSLLPDPAVLAAPSRRLQHLCVAVVSLPLHGFNPSLGEFCLSWEFVDGALCFVTNKDDAFAVLEHIGSSNGQNLREAIGPDDLYSPSFDYLASRVLLISRDRPICGGICFKFYLS
ncbi:hypothetical protein HAX54_006205 [Datura stramonium]|uniref:At4g14310 8-bladed propeller domain-containing protein n=1 Tax=Datura stramonium TaxID=4076 RepID=A0ABS8T9X4_DATST|nr:hypothetical protein [Datura stramonium]